MSAPELVFDKDVERIERLDDIISELQSLANEALDIQREAYPQESHVGLTSISIGIEYMENMHSRMRQDLTNAVRDRDNARVVKRDARKARLEQKRQERAGGTSSARVHFGVGGRPPICGQHGVGFTTQQMSKVTCARCRKILKTAKWERSS